MKLEHVAINVSDPVAMADWHVKHLGMEIALQIDDPPYTRFLRDESGRMMLEIYNNPADNVPDYNKMDPLLLHLAFISDDPQADKIRLCQAGATLVSDDRLEDGSHIVMLRDPWGVCIQFCKRARSLLVDE